MSAILRTSRPYRCLRFPEPAVAAVDARIFTTRWLGDCMGCTFCFDFCCQWGVSTEGPTRDRVFAHAAELERYLGVPREAFFPEDYAEEGWPGGHLWRTGVRDGLCVFLNRETRGCNLHQFALERDVDYHAIKPMYCTLFPLSVGFYDEDGGQGRLEPDEMVFDDEDDPLVCIGEGATMYRANRGELAYYFGPDLLAELDALEHRVAPDLAERGRSLPLVQIRARRAAVQGYPALKRRGDELARSHRRRRASGARAGG